MVNSFFGAPTFRIVVLFMTAMLVGRILCIGSSFPVVGDNSANSANPYYISTQEQLNASIGTHTDDDPIGTNKDKVHVIYGLSGNTTNFISEFYISLKSVIMNAPVDMGLGIHVLTDGKAYGALEGLTADRIKLHTLVARQPISIQVYNIESKRKQWQRRIVQSTGHWLSKKHTMGTFFRLFAFDVLPSEAEHVIYIDTDAVILSNLQELWKHRNSTSLFQWGIETRCAGFMMLNLREMKLKFWNMVNSTYDKEFKRNVNDQQIFRHLALHFPQYVSSIPVEWDNHKADNFHKLNKGHLLKNRPNMGMLHFNGGGGADINVFEEPKRIEYSAVPYYANHPWQWVGFMLRSQVPPDMPGYPVILNMTVL